MSDSKRFMPEDPASTEGGTSPTAYRSPNGGGPRSAGDPIHLPPNTNSEKFKQFTKRVAEICGEENVTIITDTSELSRDTYQVPSKAHDMFHILEKDYFVASATVSPRNVPDVQAIMRLCNEFEIPVWPFSIGRNVAYGGAAPRVPGSVCLDLGRNMNRILKVDVEGAYALVEPGVTFTDLYDYLVKNKLNDRLWVDVPDIGGGSVVGNTIERGVGYTPYGMLDTFCLSNTVS